MGIRKKQVNPQLLHLHILVSNELTPLDASLNFIDTMIVFND